LSLSASGLLALADLSTVAQRTAITGGSSWLDSFVLAPGLHYQQAADELARWGPSSVNSFSALETEPDGRVVRHRVSNAAMVQFLRRVAHPDQIVTVDVGMLPPRRTRSFGRGKGRQSIDPREPGWSDADLGWLSHLLYLASPVLTVAALVLMILLQDCTFVTQYSQECSQLTVAGWGLGLLLALMASRIINIMVIHSRNAQTQPPRLPTPHPPPSRSRPNARRLQKRPNQRSYSPADTDPPSSSSSSTTAPPRPAPPRLTTLVVSLPDGRSVALRGMSDDLAAVTSQRWLATKTHVQGYCEAGAKLLVYLVAALSGNQTQAGAIISGSLLLLTAALLGLSNAHARGLRVNGRVAAPFHGPAAEAQGRYGADDGWGRPGSAPYPTFSKHKTDSWPGSEVNAPRRTDDWAERGQAGRRARETYPFKYGVDYD
jgi:hypothetical protein